MYVEDIWSNLVYFIKNPCRDIEDSDAFDTDLEISENDEESSSDEEERKAPTQLLFEV